MRNMKKVWSNNLSSDFYLLVGSLGHREASSNSHLHSEVADGRGRMARQGGKAAARQTCWSMSPPGTDGVAARPEPRGNARDARGPGIARRAGHAANQAGVGRERASPEKAGVSTTEVFHVH